MKCDRKYSDTVSKLLGLSPKLVMLYDASQECMGAD